MRDIPVGNGSLLVTFDELYQIRDIYFPHVGQENHTEGYPFRFGVWTEGEFSWLHEEGWTRRLRYEKETLVTDVFLQNEHLGVEIAASDTVASHENIFLRRMRVTNRHEKVREIRIFLHQDFRIAEDKVGNTAFYSPEAQALVHYKRDRYFLINTEPHFDDFSTGRKAFRDQEGTWRDAEDGVLHGGAITEGSVDSTIGIYLTVEAGASKDFFYWICAGKSLSEVFALGDIIKRQTPSKYLGYTENYWRAWVNKNDVEFADLSNEIVALYKRSLLIIRTQTDSEGAILAANDSDVTERATDHYSYLWTRDGAFIANALDLAGYPSLTRRFFEFCAKIVHSKGYFLQKYNPDGTPASGWHASFDKYTRRELVPIQQDETALVLWALWEHYALYRDIEFVHRIYLPLIVRCADFMCAFRDERTRLPAPSWNLWEDRRGIHTFTCSTVVGGLRAAAKFARLFGDIERAENYEENAAEIVSAMREYLFDAEKGHFVRALHFEGETLTHADATLDASLFGVFYFGCFDVKDQVVSQTIEKLMSKLRVAGDFGGIARFENDGYMRVSDKTTGNAWFICTLWIADYFTERAETIEDLRQVVEILEWTKSRALESGVLAEQVNPLDGSPVSVAPLTWSHSTFVASVRNYVKKFHILAKRAEVLSETK